MKGICVYRSSSWVCRAFLAFIARWFDRRADPRNLLAIPYFKQHALRPFRA
jgi:hypothetical protein